MSTEILPQPPKNCKQRDLTLADRKNAAVKMAARLIETGYVKRGERMKQCMDRIAFAVCSSCGKTRITQTYLCRDRLCPVCAAGRARKHWWEMIRAAEVSNNFGGNRIAHLGLTIRNCKPKDLEHTLLRMSTAFKRCQQRKYWKENILGYARRLEITYNADKRTMHPHYHVLLVISATASDNLQMIGSRIAREWQTALQVSYLPIYDIVEAYSNKTDNPADKLIGAYAEMSKYMVKPFEVLGIPNRSHFEILVRAVSGFRIASYGGVIKQARKLAGITDADDDNAVDVEINCCNNAEIVHKTAQWALGKWVVEAEGLVQTIIDPQEGFREYHG